MYNTLQNKFSIHWYIIILNYTATIRLCGVTGQEKREERDAKERESEREGEKRLALARHLKLRWSPAVTPDRGKWPVLARGLLGCVGESGFVTFIQMFCLP